jgi:hypothetical protein
MPASFSIDPATSAPTTSIFGHTTPTSAAPFG